MPLVLCLALAVSGCETDGGSADGSAATTSAEDSSAAAASRDDAADTNEEVETGNAAENGR